MANESTKTCHFCAEEIKGDAKKCKHCGEFLDGTAHTKQFNPGIAAVLSLLIPGAGQMYRGKIGNGLVWLLCVVASYAVLGIVGLLVHIICIVNAASAEKVQ